MFLDFLILDILSVDNSGSASTEWVKTIVPFVSIILALLVGMFITPLTAMFTKRKELKIRFREKIFDKRFDAYYGLLKFIKRLKDQTLVKGIRAPGVMKNQKEFESFIKFFFEYWAENETWYEAKTLNNLATISMYILRADKIYREIKEENQVTFLNIIHPDLPFLADVLHDSVIDFFHKGIYDLNFKPIRLKSKEEDKDKRIRVLQSYDLKLFSEKKRIDQLMGGEDQSS